MPVRPAALVSNYYNISIPISDVLTLSGVRISPVGNLACIKDLAKRSTNYAACGLRKLALWVCYLPFEKGNQKSLMGGGPRRTRLAVITTEMGTLCRRRETRHKTGTSLLRDTYHFKSYHVAPIVGCRDRIPRLLAFRSAILVLTHLTLPSCNIPL